MTLRLLKPGRAATAFLFLVAIQGGCVLLGLAQALVTARTLGPELLAVVGVMFALHATIANFMDVRLTDVATHLFHSPVDSLATDDPRIYQSDVLQTCLLGAAALGLSSVAVASILGLVGLSWFVNTSVFWPWILLNFFALALITWTNTLALLMRLSERHHALGWLQLANQAISTVILTSFVITHRNLDGYFLGHAVAAAVVCCVTLVASRGIWGTAVTIWMRPKLQTLSEYRRKGRMLFWGNLQGYAKMLHRGTDVLLISLCADDRATGLYRFSRSLTDKFYTLFDAANQIYFPRLLQYVARGDLIAYRTLSGKLAFAGIGITVFALVGELLFLESLLRVCFGEAFAPAGRAIMLLTLPLGLTIGVSIPLYSWLVARGNLGWYTTASLAGAALQIAMTLGLLGFGPSATRAALGYLAYDLVVHGALVILAMQQGLIFTPSWRRTAS